MFVADISYFNFEKVNAKRIREWWWGFKSRDPDLMSSAEQTRTFEWGLLIDYCTVIIVYMHINYYMFLCAMMHCTDTKGSENNYEALWVMVVLAFLSLNIFISAFL